MSLPIGMLDRLRAAFGTANAAYQDGIVKELGAVYAENAELKGEVARWSRRVKLLEKRAAFAAARLQGSDWKEEKET